MVMATSISSFPVSSSAPSTATANGTSNEEWSDAKTLSRDEIIGAIEDKVIEFLQYISRGQEPSITLVEKNHQK